jgi:predicted DNA-binding protein (MmcQ/YjbR family)
MAVRPLTRLRKLCLAFPEAHEAEAWGEPTFRVRNKLFAMYAAAVNHHGGGRPAVWLKADPGNQALMVQATPARFFRPPYVGPSGWVGTWLDREVDWAELEGLLRDAYRLVAPKRLTMALEQAERRPARPRQAKHGSPGRGTRIVRGGVCADP